MNRPTFAQRVDELDDGKRSAAEVAQLAGCTESYVRTVRQRRGRAKPIDTARSRHRESEFIEPWVQYRSRKVAERARKRAEANQ